MKMNRSNFIHLELATTLFFAAQIGFAMQTTTTTTPIIANEVLMPVQMTHIIPLLLEGGLAKLPETIKAFEYDVPIGHVKLRFADDKLDAIGLPLIKVAKTAEIFFAILDDDLGQRVLENICNRNNGVNLAAFKLLNLYNRNKQGLKEEFRRLISLGGDNAKTFRDFEVSLEEFEQSIKPLESRIKERERSLGILRKEDQKTAQVYEREIKELEDKINEAIKKFETLHDADFIFHRGEVGKKNRRRKYINYLLTAIGEEVPTIVEIFKLLSFGEHSYFEEPDNASLKEIVLEESWTPERSCTSSSSLPLQLRSPSLDEEISQDSTTDISLKRPSIFQSKSDSYSAINIKGIFIEPLVSALIDTNYPKFDSSFKNIAHETSSLLYRNGIFEKYIFESFNTVQKTNIIDEKKPACSKPQRNKSPSPKKKRTINFKHLLKTSGDKK